MSKCRIEGQRAKMKATVKKRLMSWGAALTAREPVTVAYGGGLDSTAMIVGMVQRNEPIDLILFADTGGEMFGTYEYIHYFSDWLETQGYPRVEWVYPTNRKKERITLEAECLRLGTLPSLAFGWHTCSHRFKIVPQEKYIQSWPLAQGAWEMGMQVVKCIGFETGEEKRTFRFPDNPKYKPRFPLQEWGWDRAKCAEVVEAAGLKVPEKSACFFCPARKKHEIAELNESAPEKMKRALEMEDKARRSGKLTKTVGLGRRFAWSDYLEEIAMQRYELNLKDAQKHLTSLGVKAPKQNDTLMIGECGAVNARLWKKVITTLKQTKVDSVVVNNYDNHLSLVYDKGRMNIYKGFGDAEPLAVFDIATIGRDIHEHIVSESVKTKPAKEKQQKKATKKQQPSAKEILMAKAKKHRGGKVPDAKIYDLKGQLIKKNKELERVTCVECGHRVESEDDWEIGCDAAPDKDYPDGVQDSGRYVCPKCDAVQDCTVLDGMFEITNEGIKGAIPWYIIDDLMDREFTDKTAQMNIGQAILNSLRDQMIERYGRQAVNNCYKADKEYLLKQCGGKR